MAFGRSIALGCVTDWFEGSYQQAVLLGFLNAGRDSDAAVVCFIGGGPWEGALREPWLLNNPAFQLITSESVDGLLVPVNIINNTGTQYTDRFLSLFGGMPKCLLGFEHLGTSTVLIDNDVGVAESVRHLIRVHRFERIAFIRGPVDSDEAEHRYTVYQQSLRENDITPDPSIALSGDFNPPSGYAAAKYLFEEREQTAPSVQAVVAANDAMALGFIEYLEAHQIHYPETLAVVGFDDVYESRLSKAPLTTVRQPIYEQGREAARLLLAQLRGAAVTKTVMKTELIVRRSCGCYANKGKFQAAMATAIGNRYKFDAALVEQRQRIQLELLRTGDGRLSKLGAGWEGRLLSALAQELKEDDSSVFRRTLDEMLTKLIDSGCEPTLFHEVITVLWERLLPCTLNSPESRTALESLLDGARISICAASQRSLGAERMHAREYSGQVIRTAMSIARAKSIVDVARLLEPALTRLRVDHLDVALFEQSGLRHVLACVKGEAEIPNAALATRDFVRNCLRGRSRVGMYVAAFGEPSHALGYIAMDIDDDNAQLMAALIDSFSTAAANGVFR